LPGDRGPPRASRLHQYTLRALSRTAEEKARTEGASRADAERAENESRAEFTDKATRDAFSERAIAALLEAFPNVFDGEVVS
jgi:phosphatidylethanolamine-binding protein (PEBP) family uncharacterized protein